MVHGRKKSWPSIPPSRPQATSPPGPSRSPPYPTVPATRRAASGPADAPHLPGGHRARFRFPWGPLAAPSHVFGASSSAPLLLPNRRYHSCRQLNAQANKQVIHGGSGSPLRPAAARPPRASRLPVVGEEGTLRRQGQLQPSGQGSTCLITCSRCTSYSSSELMDGSWMYLLSCSKAPTGSCGSRPSNPSATSMARTYQLPSCASYIHECSCSYAYIYI